MPDFFDGVSGYVSWVTVHSATATVSFHCVFRLRLSKLPLTVLWAAGGSHASRPKRPQSAAVLGTSRFPTPYSCPSSIRGFLIASDGHSVMFSLLITVRKDFPVHVN
jgi:hypothetical protein